MRALLLLLLFAPVLESRRLTPNDERSSEGRTKSLSTSHGSPTRRGGPGASSLGRRFSRSFEHTPGSGGEALADWVATVFEGAPARVR